jgi:hypothetical protein
LILFARAVLMTHKRPPLLYGIAFTVSGENAQNAPVDHRWHSWKGTPTPTLTSTVVRILNDGGG